MCKNDPPSAATRVETICGIDPTPDPLDSIDLQAEHWVCLFVELGRCNSTPPFLVRRMVQISTEKSPAHLFALIRALAHNARLDKVDWSKFNVDQRLASRTGNPRESKGE